MDLPITSFGDRDVNTPAPSANQIPIASKESEPTVESDDENEDPYNNSIEEQQLNDFMENLGLGAFHGGAASGQILDSSTSMYSTNALGNSTPNNVVVSAPQPRRAVFHALAADAGQYFSQTGAGGLLNGDSAHTTPELPDDSQNTTTSYREEDDAFVDGLRRLQVDNSAVWGYPHQHFASELIRPSSTPVVSSMNTVTAARFKGQNSMTTATTVLDQRVGGAYDSYDPLGGNKAIGYNMLQSSSQQQQNTSAVYMNSNSSGRGAPTYLDGSYGGGGLDAESILSFSAQRQNLPSYSTSGVGISTIHTNGTSPNKMMMQNTMANTAGGSPRLPGGGAQTLMDIRSFDGTSSSGMMTMMQRPASTPLPSSDHRTNSLMNAVGGGGSRPPMVNLCNLEDSSVEDIVAKSCRDILIEAANNSLKAVELANTLRARVGTEVLAHIRERWGGLLSLLERHPHIFRVDRIPKNDLVTLVSIGGASSGGGMVGGPNNNAIAAAASDLGKNRAMGASPGLGSMFSEPSNGSGASSMSGYPQQQQQGYSPSDIQRSMGVAAADRRTPPIYYQQQHGGGGQHPLTAMSLGSSTPSPGPSVSGEGSVSRCLHVGNVPANMTEAQLLRELTRFGDVDCLKLVCQRSRRFAFVSFRTIEQAISAKQRMSRVHPWKSAISFAHKESQSLSLSASNTPSPAPVGMIDPHQSGGGGYSIAFNNGADQQTITMMRQHSMSPQLLQPSSSTGKSGGSSSVGNQMPPFARRQSPSLLGDRFPQMASSSAAGGGGAGALTTFSDFPELHGQQPMSLLGSAAAGGSGGGSRIADSAFDGSQQRGMGAVGSLLGLQSHQEGRGLMGGVGNVTQNAQQQQQQQYLQQQQQHHQRLIMMGATASSGGESSISDQSFYSKGTAGGALGSFTDSSRGLDPALIGVVGEDSRYLGNEGNNRKLMTSSPAPGSEINTNPITIPRPLPQYNGNHQQQQIGGLVGASPDDEFSSVNVPGGGRSSWPGGAIQSGNGMMGDRGGGLPPQYPVGGPSSSFPAGVQQQQQVLNNQQQPLGDAGVLRRLCDDTYVPTQPWPVRWDVDAFYCNAVVAQLQQFGGATTISKLRGFLRSRLNAPDNIKSVPLKAMLTAYPEFFVVRSNQVSLVSGPQSSSQEHLWPRNQ